jgi:murein DD-endopeptidase MepM/ murein hydrolase activator NlpD
VERHPGTGLLGATLALLGVGLASSPAVAEDRRCLDRTDVCLEAVRQGPVVRLRASNRTAAPQSLRITLPELTNLRPQGPVPFRAVLEPGEEREVGSLVARNPELTTAYRYEWSAAPGSMLARHDDSHRYRMPFGGDEPRVLGQGVGGRHSHQGSSRYAFDFTMPWGTPVLAARAGRVIAVRDDALASRAMRRRYDQANAVEVLHSDGTIATYAHLQRGALVRVGQEVAAGDPIGRSGDTGFSTGPHLHFMVWRRTADLHWTSVPIRFDNGSAAGFQPETGVAYAPGCRSGDPGCRGPRESESVRPAARAESAGWTRRPDGACICPNGATIHVDLPCSQVCSR